MDWILGCFIPVGTAYEVLLVAYEGRGRLCTHRGIH